MRAAIERLGGMERFVSPQDVVLIKPNIGWVATPAQGANTHPVVVAKLVSACRAVRAKRVLVSDCPVSVGARVAFLRSGIPGLRMVDGPRGVRAGKATTFPVGIARGATWDPALERRVGQVIGLETAARGGNVLLAPTINLLRHPAWGRAQETYGEDPLHMRRMAVAFVEGVQQHVIASAKHFALNSIEDTRFYVDVSADERTLREVYLPHFHAVVREARVGSVMSAYNKVNGEYCSENRALLRDILKGEWEFDGFVESDWIMGTHNTAKAANAGLDIEMPAAVQFGDPLREAVQRGEVAEEVIDEAVRRILRKKLEFGLFDAVPVSADVVESSEHTSLAREVSERSIVLLKNGEGLLPLDPSRMKAIAVVGTLADAVNLGDRGSSDATPSYAVTPLAGIRGAAAGAAASLAVRHIAADSLSPEEVTTVAGADAAIVVVGLSAEDEGEAIVGVGGARNSLALSPAHEALIHAVATANPNTVVLLEAGSALTMPWLDRARAVLLVWYPGMEGGNAIARVLFGRVNPSGRLPVSFPTDESQLPEFIHDQRAVTYGYYHGYRHLDRQRAEPLFAFGFGLSYTTYQYDELRLNANTLSSDQTLVASLDLSNDGPVAGEEVVQLYVEFPDSSVDRPVRELKAFARVALATGETKSVELEVPVADLSYWDVASSAWKVAPGTYSVRVGSSSRDLPLRGAFTVR